jgi:exodeoxyribonuclease VII small subunit
MSAKKTELNYDAAIEELEEIINGLEDESIGVDELSDRIKRAAELIQFCKAKLYRTDEEVKEILTALQAKEEGA